MGRLFHGWGVKLSACLRVGRGSDQAELDAEAEEDVDVGKERYRIQDGESHLSNKHCSGGLVVSRAQASPTRLCWCQMCLYCTCKEYK